jgi:hypothetical protein
MEKAEIRLVREVKKPSMDFPKRDYFPLASLIEEKNSM